MTLTLQLVSLTVQGDNFSGWAVFLLTARHAACALLVLCQLCSLETHWPPFQAASAWYNDTYLVHADPDS